MCNPPNVYLPTRGKIALSYTSPNLAQDLKCSVVGVFTLLKWQEELSPMDKSSILLHSMHDIKIAMLGGYPLSTRNITSTRREKLVKQQ